MAATRRRCCFWRACSSIPTIGGGALVAAVADWGRAQGCSEFASDAELENVDSHAMHRALGFVETERVVYFRWEL
jgi:aminoglycoside 6'-N-acetyltransferase I|uniref:GNAT family N-acetyltransferase n=1 Tax=Sphingomonas sp. Sph1(2015) TaxID=1628084 RepID=UPI001F51E4E7|nr:GNAT family N-acetyltransferase [Sphingomonas sp. Sph1(2015)]